MATTHEEELKIKERALLFGRFFCVKFRGKTSLLIYQSPLFRKTPRQLMIAKSANESSPLPLQSIGHSPGRCAIKSLWASPYTLIKPPIKLTFLVSSKGDAPRFNRCFPSGGGALQHAGWGRMIKGKRGAKASQKEYTALAVLLFAFSSVLSLGFLSQPFSNYQ